jgi:uncharacterized membrane protein
MTVGYALPGILRQLMDTPFVSRAVESTIQADLERFREYALKVKAQ